MKDIETLGNDAKRLLKYLETKQQGIKVPEIITKCYLLKEGGSQRTKVSNASKELRSIEVEKVDTAGFHRGILKERIKFYLENHGATDQEIENIYNHILMEMLQ